MQIGPLNDKLKKLGHREMHEFHKFPEDRDPTILKEMSELYKLDLTDRLIWRDRYYEVYIGDYDYMKPTEVLAMMFVMFITIGMSIIWYNYT